MKSADRLRSSADALRSAANLSQEEKDDEEREKKVKKSRRRSPPVATSCLRSQGVITRKAFAASPNAELKGPLDRVPRTPRKLVYAIKIEEEEEEEETKAQQEIAELKQRLLVQKQKREGLAQEFQASICVLDKFFAMWPTSRGVLGRVLFSLYFLHSIWLQWPVNDRVPDCFRRTCRLMYSFRKKTDVPPLDQDLLAYLGILDCLQFFGAVCYIWRERLGASILAVYLTVMMVTRYGYDDFFMYLALFGVLVSYLQMEIIWIWKTICLFFAAMDIVYMQKYVEILPEGETKDVGTGWELGV